jgi:hypothetical protein
LSRLSTFHCIFLMRSATRWGGGGVCWGVGGFGEFVEEVTAGEEQRVTHNQTLVLVVVLGWRGGVWARAWGKGGRLLAAAQQVLDRHLVKWRVGGRRSGGGIRLGRAGHGCTRG